MLEFDVQLENLTTDEDEVTLHLPMSESEIRSKLMRDCEYLVIDHGSLANFKNYDDIFALNEVINRISTENPLITNELLAIILETSSYDYLDDEEFLEKICQNDFMYEEVTIPEEWTETKEEYAAYVLCMEHEIPFSIFEQEMVEIKRAGKDYDDWSSIWDVYSFMGFYMSEDTDDESKIYIVNMEDCE